MTWHTAAYSSSVTNGLTNAAINALSDNVLRVGSANGFVLQEDMMLLYALAAPVNGTAQRVTSPKFSQFGPIQIAPLQAAAKTADGILVATWPYRPPIFRNQEEVTAFTDTGGAAPGVETMVVAFSSAVDPIPPGEELVIKATSTTAAVANAWTLVTLVLAQALPEGRYAMVSSDVQSTNAIAHRWTFFGQFYRPGLPSTTAFTNRQFPGVTDFRLGQMGQFSNVTLANLEVLASAADASHTIFMRCIKVA